MSKNEKSLTVKYLTDLPTDKPVVTDAMLKEHSTPESLWTVVHNHVFDLTDFASEHPGGWEVIEEHAGKDATLAYEEGQHAIQSIRELKQYYVGEYEGKKMSL